MRKGLIAAAWLAATAFASAPALGQPAEPPPTAAPAAPAPKVVAAGTQIVIAIAEPVGSKKTKRGDKFAIRLAAPITLGDRVVVPAGMMGVGEVVDAAPAQVHDPIRGDRRPQS